MAKFDGQRTQAWREYRCSFCDKNQDMVKRLIAGPRGVFICNECIALCQEIISEEEALVARMEGHSEQAGDSWIVKSRSGHDKPD